MLDTKLRMLFLVTLLSAFALHASQAFNIGGPPVKSAVFLSPPFFLQPGSVANKFYFDVPFPKGHIGLKSFDAEVVDENGVPVPLHETYLHHWVVERYYGKKEPEIKGDSKSQELELSKVILVRNSGICDHTLGQYFGLGSETRKTATWIPDPYAIEVGNPKDTPNGFEERWLLNVHAIDTRGVEDRRGCTECNCKLYNVTKDEYGKSISDSYIGGLYCCYDQTHCLLKEGFRGKTRKLFLKYTVRWIDWDVTIEPVKIYIFDVTDTGKSHDGVDGSSCKVEYEVKDCSLENKANGECIDSKSARLVIPSGGDIVYGVAHQHTGGVGSALYGQDGRVLCTSIPTYGEGKEAGNEADYIIGMSTCYPKPGTVKVADGETLTLVSNYSSSQMHTGVMGLFYILVADQKAGSKITLSLYSPATWGFDPSKIMRICFLSGFGVLFVILGLSFCRKNNREGYQSLVIT
ncbi:uncharacterized protein [Typha angustifolia]|uniref:uncharacterized protein n=1 Tax=Typha angustifolia TaxID=59011 RepID=UPI003C3043C1